MDIEQLKAKKKRMGYTNAELSELSGVPLGTLQKIFSGTTTNPRIETIEAIEKVLQGEPYRLESEIPQVKEEALAYQYGRDLVPAHIRKYENYGAEFGERWPRQGFYTLDDYYAIPDDIRVELIDGVIFDMTAPALIHQRLLAQLHLEFHQCIVEHEGDCEVMFAPVDVRLDLDNKTMVQPDLLIICHEEESEKNIEGAPDLVIEILSPSTRSKDNLLKLNKYCNAGVREYWIVDPKNEKVLVYTFEKDTFPSVYSFTDTIPVGISGGTCGIDFGRIRDKAYRLTHL